MSPVPQIFEFESQQIRTVVVDETPRFVVADLCTALSLSNPTMSVKRIDEDDLSSAEVVDSRGQMQTVNVVNESGMYQLIFMSRKEAARRFRKWVTSEVLPTLRRTGRYEMAPTAAELEIAQASRRAELARLDLSVIHALDGIVDPRWRESLGRHAWATYKGEKPEIAAEDRLLMVQPYLAEKRVSKADIASIGSTFGKRVKAAYVAEYGRAPEEVPALLNGRERPVKGYYERDRFLFDAVFAEHYAHLSGPQQLELGAA